MRELPIADFKLEIDRTLEGTQVTPEELRDRTKAFALRVIRLAGSFPRDRIGDVFARQIVRSGTSLAANYRAACRSRSHKEFVAKIGLVEEEADETVFWIELAADARLVGRKLVGTLVEEGKEILAIITASRKTAQGRRRKRTQ